MPSPVRDAFRAVVARLVTADPSTQLNRALAGRYEISHEIGRGGMATAYLARDIGLTYQLAVIAVDENSFEYYYGTSDGLTAMTGIVMHVDGGIGVLVSQRGRSSPDRKSASPRCNAVKRFGCQCLCPSHPASSTCCVL